MVSQALRKLKVLWASAFTLQTRERARDGRDAPQAPPAFSHHTAFPLRCLPGATPGKDEEKGTAVLSAARGLLQTESGKGSHSGPESVRMAFFFQ